MEAVQLIRPTPEDYGVLTELWEASVRATHDFLPELDIQYFKPFIQEQYLAAVELYALQEQGGKFLGFLGVLDGKIEMLFLHPEAIGKGYGRQLCKFALEELKATSLDVNEQNPKAVKFYQKMGFEIIGRSPLDGMGKPYPLLHMKLKD